MTAPAAEAETTPAIGTTPTTVEEPGQRVGKDAVGVEGYEKMKAEAFAEAAAEKNAPAIEEEPPPAEAAAPLAEVPNPQSQAPIEEAPATTEPAAAAEEDEDKDPVRIRISGLEDSHLVAAANKIARKEKIPFAAAWERVAPKKQRDVASGTPAATPAGETPAATPAKSETGRTRAEIEADITARKADKRKAAAEMDNLAILDADDAIETLRDELGQVTTAEARAEQERQTAEKTKFENSVKASQDLAKKNWPDEIADDNSALSKRMVELADAYEKNPDLAHHVFEADAPFFFADLAAKELGILPKDLRKPAATPAPATTTPKPATPAATKPALRNQSAVVRPAQPAAVPASGAARTAEGPAVDTLGLDTVRSVYDYETAKAKAMAGAT